MMLESNTVAARPPTALRKAAARGVLRSGAPPRANSASMALSRSAAAASSVDRLPTDSPEASPVRGSAR